MNGTQQRYSAATAYRAVEGIGAAPEDFIKMALDATHTLLLRAELAIDAGEQMEKAQALGSAGNVVEFMLGLTGIAPGELSECLASVYQYVLAAILKGNAGDDREAVTAARVAVDELAVAWRSIFPDTVGREESGLEPALSGGLDYA